MTVDQEQALQLATEAGHILLENGAEISRVEETMERIAAAYGVEDESFFVLSNGIIATGQHYASAEFIPIRGTQLSRVVEVNQLSREVERRRPAGMAQDGVSVSRRDAGAPMPVSELASRLQAIRTAPGHPAWEIILGIALGVSAFSILFGGSLTDAAATLACGLILGTFMAYVTPHLSRLIGNVAGGLVGGLLCILAVHLATQPLSPSATQLLSHSATLHLPNMIIGTIIALVPGVPFTNGIRDLANEDYIAGTTRLTDAFLAFLCIALGVALAFIVEGLFAGGIMQLGAPVKDPLASAWYIQLPAAFIGTIGFSALFGAPRRYYLDCGLAGTAGWAVYLLLASAGPTHVVGAAFLGALAVAVMAHLLAVTRKCPVTVFLICGIIPLVPGGGIFWTAYYIITNQLRLAATTGFTALKVTIAIAGAIILAAALASRLQRKQVKNH